MNTDLRTVPRRVEKATPERAPVREEMRAARGLFVGLALSAIIWLVLFVVWLAL